MINSYELDCGVLVSEERDEKNRLVKRWNSLGEYEEYKYEEYDGYLIIKSHHKEIVNEPEAPEWGEWDAVSGFYKDGVAMRLDIEYDDYGNIIGYSILPRFKRRKIIDKQKIPYSIYI